jgi:hypothetical protein
MQKALGQEFCDKRKKQASVGGVLRTANRSRVGGVQGVDGVFHFVWVGDVAGSSVDEGEMCFTDKV